MLQKIYTTSSYIWLVSCYGFAALIAVMTKFMTHDPNLSGGPETPYLIPMLTLIAVGFLSFGIAILTWIVAKFRKTQLRTKHFWISACLVAVLTTLCIVFLIAYKSANAGYTKGDYTGQQLFDAVNNYRASNNKPELKLDPYICDDLVDRYLKIKSGDVGHAGFEEWYKAQDMDKRFSLGAELYIKDTATTADAIKFWEGSPGHRLSLLGDFSVGCAYALNGTGVLILGEPIKK
jgi:hypothetical protein